MKIRKKRKREHKNKKKVKNSRQAIILRFLKKEIQRIACIFIARTKNKKSIIFMIFRNQC
jgi:hypothetical protein